MRKLLLATTALIALSAAPASAFNVTYTSSGAFSNVQNCVGCAITGGGTVLDMSGFNNSTLTAGAGGNSFSVPPNATNQILGSIAWVNNASTFTDQAFTATYTFNMSLTSPFVQNDSQAFSLTITQPTNPPGDHIVGLTNALLAGINFGNPNLSVANLHFGEVGDGTYTAATGDWYNPEYGHSTMNIYADFLDVTPNVGAVPEPSTWAMMLLGFCGIVVMGAKRRREGGSAFRLV